MKVEIWHDPVADSKPRLQPQHSRGRLSSMGSFRTFLIILWLALAAYTAVVISRHGLGLLPIFFGDVAKLGWPGQFNLDFLCFLILSALWTAWRNGFSAIALLLAFIAFFGGAGFLLPYLVFLTVRERGNMPRALIGARTRRDEPYSGR